MNKENFKLFPTLVTKYDDFLTQKESKIIFDFLIKVESDNQILAEKPELFKGDASSTHKTHGKIIDILPNLGIKNKLEECLREYESDFGLHKLKITNSWFNIQSKNSVLIPHMHPSSILSGVLYINVNENSSKIYFDNPNKLINYFSSSNKTEFGYEYYYFKPEVGTLLLFPSWLSHGNIHEMNQTDNRIAISFNTDFVID